MLIASNVMSMSFNNDKSSALARTSPKPPRANTQNKIAKDFILITPRSKISNKRGLEEEIQNLVDNFIAEQNERLQESTKSKFRQTGVNAASCS